MNILSEMSSIYYELTISEKRIAEYILEHTDEVQMMSISELAEVCHVGEATITRFCKRFHSRGYTALKIELVTTEMEDILSQAKQNGATIIMLTRFCKSPGAEKSDIVLQCGSNESPLQQGSVAAKIAQFYVLDILYHEYCNKNPEISEQNKEKIMRALANRHQ